MSHTPRIARNAIWVFSQILCIVTLASAGPPPCTAVANVSFTLPDGTLLGGGWHMYLVSVGEYEAAQNMTDFAGDFADVRERYPLLKRQCGLYGAFHQELYDIPVEDRGSVYCEIDGILQDRTCFRDASEIPECDALAASGKLGSRYAGPTSQTYNGYLGELTFASYYQGYLWDIGKASFYSRFAPMGCSLERTTCGLSIPQDKGPPYVIVLERENSTDDVYISEPVEIHELDVFFETNYTCWQEVEMPLTMTRLEKAADNKLMVGFFLPGERAAESGLPHATIVFIIAAALALAYATKRARKAGHA